MRAFSIGSLRFLAFLLVAGAIGGIGYACYRFGGALSAVGASVVAAVIVAVPGYHNVPTLKLGLVTFLGMRTGRVLSEGANFILWPFESVITCDAEVQTLVIEPQKYFCRDKLAVILGGELSWQNDEDLLPTAGIMNRERIEDELRSAIRNELGIIAGANRAADFTMAREAASDMLNCILTMGTPPHIAKGILPGERLAFYAGQHLALRSRVRKERQSTEDRSELANRCGVRPVFFALSVGYTERTGEVLEAEGRAVLEANAAAVTAGKKKRIAKEHQRRGLKPLEAEAAAEVTMRLSHRKIHTVEGMKEFRPFSPPESRNFGGALCVRN